MIAFTKKRAIVVEKKKGDISIKYIKKIKIYSIHHPNTYSIAFDTSPVDFCGIFSGERTVCGLKC